MDEGMEEENDDAARREKDDHTGRGFLTDIVGASREEDAHGAGEYLTCRMQGGWAQHLHVGRLGVKF